jgi:hypothetical protein
MTLFETLSSSKYKRKYPRLQELKTHLISKCLEQVASRLRRRRHSDILETKKQTQILREEVASEDKPLIVAETPLHRFFTQKEVTYPFLTLTSQLFS